MTRLHDKCTTPHFPTAHHCRPSRPDNVTTSHHYQNKEAPIRYLCCKDFSDSTQHTTLISQALALRQGCLLHHPGSKRWLHKSSLTVSKLSSTSMLSVPWRWGQITTMWPHQTCFAICAWKLSSSVPGPTSGITLPWSKTVPRKRRLKKSWMYRHSLVHHSCNIMRVLHTYDNLP